VVGRGVVTVRVQGEDTWVVPTGETVDLEQIAARGRSELAPTAAPARTVTATSGSDVDSALAAGDIAGALALVGELDRRADDDAARETVRSLIARTAAAVGDPVDVTETVRPLVDLALELRAQARAEKRWADSDTIRDGLAAAGIEVRDTPDGVEWEVRR
jgi:cysteinyl-tRNA synthetase